MSRRRRLSQRELCEELARYFPGLTLHWVGRGEYKGRVVLQQRRRRGDPWEPTGYPWPAAWVAGLLANGVRNGLRFPDSYKGSSKPLAIREAINWAGPVPRRGVDERHLPALEWLAGQREAPKHWKPINRRQI
jgi:hypothetical protein